MAERKPKATGKQAKGKRAKGKSAPKGRAKAEQPVSRVRRTRRGASVRR